MTAEELDTSLTSLLRAAGFPGARVTPRGLALILGVPRQEASLALRRAARKGLLVGGRVPSDDR
jgi:hypothetical protein